MSTTITPTEQNIDINVTNDVIDVNVTNNIVDVNATTQQINIDAAGAYPLPNSVFSVFGRVGDIVAAEGDYTLTQLAGVTITNPVTDEILKYNGTNWVNGIFTSSGTVTNVSALTLGTTGTDLSSSVVNSTSTPVITLNVPTASATNRGALSSADWTTFNSKQTALNGTGFVKISGTTISYDNNTYYLASNPNAYISLGALSGGAGISYNNTTGVIASTITQYTDALSRAALSFAAGSGAYNSTTGVITIPTNNNQITNGANYITLGSLSAGTGISYNNTTGVITNTITQYTDALARASISLTTTGLSGAATYNNTTGVLNIPQYIGDVTSVFGRTGAVVATNGDYTTSQVTEGTNLYYTEGRVSANSDVAANTTARHNAVTISTANGLSLSTQALSLGLASSSTNGALSSSDWSTFNNKQAAGNYITSLTGEATASGPGAASVTLSTSAVTGKLLSGLNLTGGGTIAATDSILAAFGKVQNQISGMVGGVTYQGTWNASTNTPTLTSSVGTKGYYYIVSVDGSTNLNGNTDWKVGDWAIFNGSTWDKVDNTDAVSSVNGFTGAVSLTTSNITEGSNLYYTEARVNANTNVAANTAARHNAVTLGTANGLSLSTQVLSLALASGSTTGALTSTDWNTFNGKQAALSGTGFVKISGTTISYDNSTYVTTDTFQTISASKTFGVGFSLASAGGTNQLTSFVNTNSIHSGSAGTNIFGFNNSNNIYFGKGLNNGGVITYNNAAVRFYALPDADGTIALVGGSGVGTVTSVAALTIGTTGTDLSSTVANGTTTPVITLNVPTASATNRGALSSTDWTTFNNKQAALTNPVTGTGTTNYLPKFTGASTIGNSAVFESSGNVGINTALPSGIVNGKGLVIYDTLYPRLILQNSTTGTGTSAYSGMWMLGNDLYVQNSSTTGSVKFAVNSSSDAMTLNASGNLGLGVTPSAWGAGSFAFQTQGGAVWSFSSAYMDIWQNSYYNGTSSIYQITAAASFYRQSAGNHEWNIAPSGTAGTTISWTQAMTLNASGNLSLGNTNDTYKLDVSGVVRATSSSSTGYIAQTTANSVHPYFRWVANNRSYWAAAIDSGTDATFKIGGGNTIGSSPFFTIDSGTNASTFTTTLAVTGAATFSSRINGVVGGTAYNTAGLWLQGSSSTDGIAIGGTGGGDKTIDTYGGTLKINGTAGNGLSVTGAATFSSSVTAGGTNYLSNTSTGTATTYQRILNTGGDLILGLNNSAGNALATGGLAYATLMYNNTATALQFGTNAAINMTIASSGNVGIGTTSPGYKLDVLGTSGNISTDIANGTLINIDGGSITSTNFGVGIAFVRTGSQMAYIKAARENTSNEAGFLAFAAQNSAGNHPEAMRIKSTGIINLSNVPSSSAGLSSGDIYKTVAGVLMIV
jgi:hypothetical protein